MKNTLIIVVGPTAVGKTSMAIELARHFNSDILSADSRQFYKELKIGTAAPTEKEIAQAKHHFIGHLSIHDYYNVSRFEQEVDRFLHTYFETREVAILVGGSGLYIDAVTKGIEKLPDPDENLRKSIQENLIKNGIESIQAELQQLDPEYYEKVDKNNPNRLMRALEVCRMTGRKYSELRKREEKKHDFQIVKIGLNMLREELFKRIHQRTDQMIADGLIDEVKNLLPNRGLNALNTVGYKEIFNYLDGIWSLELATEKIKTNTRRYAKRQLTWFKRDQEIAWFEPDKKTKIVDHIQRCIGN